MQLIQNHASGQWYLGNYSCAWLLGRVASFVQERDEPFVGDEDEGRERLKQGRFEHQMFDFAMEVAGGAASWRWATQDSPTV